MMDIQESFSEFMKNIAEKAKKAEHERTEETYAGKARVFHKFLVEELGIDNDDFLFRVQRITPDEILSSVKYYVSTRSIKCKTTADNYFTVICLYFSFLQAKFGLENPYFVGIQERENLKNLVDNQIVALRLKEKEPAPPISYTDSESLISLCDVKIESFKAETLRKKGYNTNFTYYISALITKLVLFTGMKNNVISTLKISNYNLDLNIIEANGYFVRLPNLLSMQMKTYLSDVRPQLIGEREDCQLLFVGRSSSKKELDNATMFRILDDIINSKSAVAIAKFAIIEMIKKGITPTLIMRFTGFSDEVYNYCQEFVDDIEEYSEVNDANRILDSKLRSMPLFDKL